MIPYTDKSSCLVAFALILSISGCATQVIAPVEEGPDEIQPFATDGGEASYHLLLAEMALERDQFDAAAREYRKAAQLSDEAEVAQRAVILSFSLGRNTEALVSAKRWVQLDPENLEAHRYLASLYLREKDLDNAVVELNAMLNLYGDIPDDAFLSLTGMLLEEPDLATATRAMERLVAQQPPFSATILGRNSGPARDDCLLQQRVSVA